MVFTTPSRVDALDREMGFRTRTLPLPLPPCCQSPFAHTETDFCFFCFRETALLRRPLRLDALLAETPALEEAWIRLRTTWVSPRLSPSSSPLYLSLTPPRFFVLTYHLLLSTRRLLYRRVHDQLLVRAGRQNVRHGLPVPRTLSRWLTWLSPHWSRTFSTGVSLSRCGVRN